MPETGDNVIGSASIEVDLELNRAALKNFQTKVARALGQSNKAISGFNNQTSASFQKLRDNIQLGERDITRYSATHATKLSAVSRDLNKHTAVQKKNFAEISKSLQEWSRNHSASVTRQQGEIAELGRVQRSELQAVGRALADHTAKHEIELKKQAVAQAAYARKREAAEHANLKRGTANLLQELNRRASVAKEANDRIGRALRLPGGGDASFGNFSSSFRRNINDVIGSLSGTSGPMGRLTTFTRSVMTSLRALLIVAAALSPVLVSLASSAGFASMALVALAPAALGAVQGVLALMGAFTGVVSAIKESINLEKQAKDSSAQLAAKKMSDASAIRSALEGIRNAEDSYRQAQERSVDAQRAVRRAQEDLNEARKEAKRDLEDLKALTAELALDEEGAVLSLERAKERYRELTSGMSKDDEAAAIALARAHERYNEVLKDPKHTALDIREALHDISVAAERASEKASSLDIREALLDIKRAERSLINIRKERAENAKEVSRIEREGIDSTDKVRSAKEQVTAAEKNYRQSLKDVADAQRQINQATTALNELRIQQAAEATASTAAEQRLAGAMADLSPVGRKMVSVLLDLREKSIGWRRAMEEAVLPGFISFLEDIQKKGRSGKSILDVLVLGTARLGSSIGRTVKRLGGFAKSEFFKGHMLRINRENVKLFDSMGRAVYNLMRPLTRIFSAAAVALLERFGVHLEGVTTNFSNWVDTFSDAELISFFKRAGDELSKWWTIAVNLGRILGGILKAAFPSGSGLVKTLGDLTDRIADWANSKEGQKSIKAFFDKITNFIKNFDYKSFWEAVKGISALVIAAKVASVLKTSNPLMLLLAAVAVKYPKETADFLGKIADHLIKVLKWADDHPKAATALLGLIAAYKGLNVLRGLKLPNFKDFKMSLFGDRGDTPATPLYVEDATGGGGIVGGGKSGKTIIPIAGAATLIASAIILGPEWLKAYENSKKTPDSKKGLRQLATESFLGITHFRIGEQFIKNIGKNILNALPALSPALAALVKVFESPLKAIKDKVKEWWDKLRQPVVTGTKDVVGRISNMWSSIGTLFGLGISATSLGISDWRHSLMLSISSLRFGVANSISLMWSSVGSLFRSSMKSLATQTGQFVGANLLSFKNLRLGLFGEWTWIRDNIFTAFKSGLKSIPDAARQAVLGIYAWWNKLQTVIRTPVYNGAQVINALIGGFSGIASTLGVTVKLSKIVIPEFKTSGKGTFGFNSGGIVPGYGTTDTVRAMLTPGEGILTKDEMAKLGGEKGFNQLRQYIQHYNSGGIVQQPVQKFSHGGVVKNVPYASMFNSVGHSSGVSAKLLAAVAKVESNFNKNAVSPAGAIGLMQFMPSTARAFGINPRDPLQSIQAAAKYLKSLYKRFKSWGLALTGYNVGPNAVSGVNDYARKVLKIAGGDISAPGGDSSGILDSITEKLGSGVINKLLAKYKLTGKNPLLRTISSMVGKTGAAMRNKLTEEAKKMALDSMAGIVTGGGDGKSGNHVAMKKWLLARFPSARASADTGRRDGGYHGKGRALDIFFADGSERRGGGTALKAFNAIKSTFFRNIKELIWDFAKGNAVWDPDGDGPQKARNHFFTGPSAGPGTHNDHIHWAMDTISRVNPGWFMGYNGTGKPETLVNSDLINNAQSGDVYVYIGNEAIDGHIVQVVKKQTEPVKAALRRGRGGHR